MTPRFSRLIETALGSAVTHGANSQKATEDITKFSDYAAARERLRDYANAVEESRQQAWELMQSVLGEIGESAEFRVAASMVNKIGLSLSSIEQALIGHSQFPATRPVLRRWVKGLLSDVERDERNEYSSDLAVDKAMVDAWIQRTDNGTTSDRVQVLLQVFENMKASEERRGRIVTKLVDYGFLDGDDAVSIMGSLKKAQFTISVPKNRAARIREEGNQAGRPPIKLTLPSQSPIQEPDSHYFHNPTPAQLILAFKEKCQVEWNGPTGWAQVDENAVTFGEAFRRSDDFRILKPIQQKLRTDLMMLTAKVPVAKKEEPTAPADPRPLSPDDQKAIEKPLSSLSDLGWFATNKMPMCHSPEEWAIADHSGRMRLATVHGYYGEKRALAYLFAGANRMRATLVEIQTLAKGIGSIGGMKIEQAAKDVLRTLGPVPPETGLKPGEFRIIAAHTPRPPALVEFDNSQAEEEGWKLAGNHIQTNFKNSSAGNSFGNDLAAQMWVQEQAEKGSEYHARALRHCGIFIPKKVFSKEDLEHDIAQGLERLEQQRAGANSPLRLSVCMMTGELIKAETGKPFDALNPIFNEANAKMSYALEVLENMGTNAQSLRMTATQAKAEFWEAVRSIEEKLKAQPEKKELEIPDAGQEFNRLLVEFATASAEHGRYGAEDYRAEDKAQDLKNAEQKMEKVCEEIGRAWMRLAQQVLDAKTDLQHIEGDRNKYKARVEQLGKELVKEQQQSLHDRDALQGVVIQREVLEKNLSDMTAQRDQAIKARDEFRGDRDDERERNKALQEEISAAKADCEAAGKRLDEVIEELAKAETTRDNERREHEYAKKAALGYKSERDSAWAEVQVLEYEIKGVRALKEHAELQTRALFATGFHDLPCQEPGKCGTGWGKCAPCMVREALGAKEKGHGLDLEPFDRELALSGKRRVFTGTGVEVLELKIDPADPRGRKLQGRLADTTVLNVWEPDGSYSDQRANLMLLKEPAPSAPKLGARPFDHGLVGKGYYVVTVGGDVVTKLSFQANGVTGVLAGTPGDELEWFYNGELKLHDKRRLEATGNLYDLMLVPDQSVRPAPTLQVSRSMTFQQQAILHLLKETDPSVEWPVDAAYRLCEVHDTYFVLMPGKGLVAVTEREVFKKLVDQISQVRVVLPQPHVERGTVIPFDKKHVGKYRIITRDGQEVQLESMGDQTVNGFLKGMPSLLISWSDLGKLVSPTIEKPHLWDLFMVI